jgi:hypothetical protein
MPCYRALSIKLHTLAGSKGKWIGSKECSANPAAEKQLRFTCLLMGHPLAPLIMQMAPLIIHRFYLYRKPVTSGLNVAAYLANLLECHGCAKCANINSKLSYETACHCFLTDCLKIIELLFELSDYWTSEII